MKAYLRTNFFIRINRANKNGEYPIYVRFNLNGLRKDFSTNLYITKSKWDEKLKQAKGNTESSRTINSYLDNIKVKANTLFLTLSLEDPNLKLETFINHFLGKKQKARMLVPIFRDHNQRIKQLVGADYSIETYEIYERTLRHTVEFMSNQYNIKDIEIDKIDNAFIADYDFHLRTHRRCSNNTTVKYIKNFKKIIRICIANGWLTRDPFINYKSKTITVERNYLSEDEMNRIINKQITIDRLDIVRDMFLFSCFTGLAYIDVKQLTPQHLQKGIDGNTWICTHRQKTDSPSKIPLLEIPRLIIEKYIDHPKSSNEGTLLPILSNQKMNAYLKEIADICGINKVLTFHCARHTFATTVTLSNGVPIETVSKMLGHKSIKITQHYAKITDRKVANDMEVLKNLLSSNKSTNIKNVSS